MLNLPHERLVVATEIRMTLAKVQEVGDITAAVLALSVAQDTLTRAIRQSGPVRSWPKDIAARWPTNDGATPYSHRA